MKTDIDTAPFFAVLASTFVILALLSFIMRGSHKAIDVTLPDGRHVACVKTHGGGITCDWGNAKMIFIILGIIFFQAAGIGFYFSWALALVWLISAMATFIGGWWAGWRQCVVEYDQRLPQKSKAAVVHLNPMTDRIESEDVWVP